MKKEKKHLIILIAVAIALGIVSFLVMSATSRDIQGADLEIADCPAPVVCPACNNNFGEIRREDVDYRTDGKYDNWERFVLPEKGDREYWEIKIGEDTWDKEELEVIKLEREK